MHVHLFRDHRTEGWSNMDRYAECLARTLPGVLPPRWRITMPELPSPGRNAYVRLAVRAVRHPVWARRRQGPVNHVLDHSGAHLLYGLDPARTVVTVHDLTPRHFAGHRLGVSDLVWALAWRALGRARHIIAVSRFVARELRTQMELPNARIHVVPNGVSGCFRRLSDHERHAARSSLHGGGEALLLHVGSAHPRKNLTGLLRAMAILRRQGEPVMLVQAGASPGGALLREVRALGLSRAVRLLGPVSESKLVGLYNAADLFVFPSLYEGFALPVLEAMACGVPVIAGNVASLPEVVGRAGLLVDPLQPEMLARAIVQALGDPALQHRLRHGGLERARTFNWERTARETVRVYRLFAA